MPDLILTCGQNTYARKSIPVRLYKRYTEIMERDESRTVQEAIEADVQILAEAFGIPAQEAEDADVEEILTVAKEIHFMMQDVVTQKFIDLNPEHTDPVEKEESAFDEYDEENGYNEGEEERDLWRVCRENVDRVIKLCIRILGNSYNQTMEADIMSLLDYVAFEIRTLKEK